jgi:hypothetical protein
LAIVLLSKFQPKDAKFLDLHAGLRLKMDTFFFARDHQNVGFAWICVTPNDEIPQLPQAQRDMDVHPPKYLGFNEARHWDG